TQQCDDELDAAITRRWDGDPRRREHRDPQWLLGRLTFGDLARRRLRHEVVPAGVELRLAVHVETPLGLGGRASRRPDAPWSRAAAAGIGGCGAARMTRACAV